jgi:hypothetical protein
MSGTSSRHATLVRGAAGSAALNQMTQPAVGRRNTTSTKGMQ